MEYNSFDHKKSCQGGQTLIETMVAIFILVMGITAALGLAIYAYGNSSNVTQSIIATGLAREGIEAIKNMRDTNWLQGTISDPATNPPGCYSFVKGDSSAKCYKTWETQWYNFSPSGGSKTYYVSFDPSDPKYWKINQDGQQKFGLNFDPNVSGSNFKGFYSTDVFSPVLDGSSSYYRSVTITESANGPFSQDTGPLVLVDSQVWWTGKKCNQVQTFAAALPSCRVDIQTYLTNWKNY